MMNEKEAIEMLKKWNEDLSLFDDDEEGIECHNIAIRALEDSIKNKWVPVSEELPEENLEVLVTVKYDDGARSVMTSWLQDGVWVVKKSPLHPTVIAWKYESEAYEE